MDCPSCAEPNPERARFCLACGRPLPQTSGRTAGARKVVTVVFSDLAGSTGLGERLAYQGEEPADPALMVALVEALAVVDGSLDPGTG